MVLSSIRQNTNTFLGCTTPKVKAKHHSSSSTKVCHIWWQRRHLLVTDGQQDLSTKSKQNTRTTSMTRSSIRYRKEDKNNILDWGTTLGEMKVLVKNRSKMEKQTEQLSSLEWRTDMLSNSSWQRAINAYLIFLKGIMAGFEMPWAYNTGSFIKYFLFLKY